MVTEPDSAIGITLDAIRPNYVTCGKGLTDLAPRPRVPQTAKVVRAMTPATTEKTTWHSGASRSWTPRAATEGRKIIVGLVEEVLNEDPLPPLSEMLRRFRERIESLPGEDGTLRVAREGERGIAALSG